MNDHLCKPIDACGLYQTLGRWLAPRAGGAEEPRERPEAASPGGTLPDPRHVNMEEALLNLDENLGLYRKVAGMFLGDAPACWERFRQARASGDREGATRAVHTLKSLAANVGAEALRDHARVLEAASNDGDEPAVTAGSPAAEQELTQVLATLTGFLSAPCE